jgi:hypothetical protein
MRKDRSEDARKRSPKKTDVLGEDHFGFRRSKGKTGASGMLRIVSEKTLDTDEDVCAFFIDWQKAFDRAHGNKLMNILKETGTD